ncbi:hypothetical protein [Pseudoduganella umbonata]|uniref:Uncharacterized protein n=1 Tax=Pseudoduganella umbonata TaxID=864828 RepID=A0A4P8HM19_9BURK|nr:hypothetical protein [Pseudoduganella umbonata]MBB3219999.1 hypothetical protein [Pseudoduganella umbonata]QCP10006.1 hypothetical protein FCL38_05910 [Pseudoduganella umbonata]
MRGSGVGAFAFSQADVMIPVRPVLGHPRKGNHEVHRTVFCAAAVPALAGCGSMVGHGGSRQAGSIADYLYPDAMKAPAMAPTVTRLRLAVRVGIAFVPGGGRTNGLTETAQRQLLDRVKGAFTQYDYSGSIEVIPARTCARGAVSTTSTRWRACSTSTSSRWLAGIGGAFAALTPRKLLQKNRCLSPVFWLEIGSPSARKLDQPPTARMPSTPPTPPSARSAADGAGNLPG